MRAASSRVAHVCRERARTLNDCRLLGRRRSFVEQLFFHDIDVVWYVSALEEYL